MSMSYTEFKTYLTTFLWKGNDTELVASLDQLILMATAELSRKIPINRREVAVTVPVTGSAIPFPDDFKQLVSLNSSNYTYSKATESSLIRARNNNASNTEVSLYCVIGSSIELAQVIDAADFTLVYRIKLPDYKVADVSWVEDEYLDLYTYTVLKHTAPWLRNDERVALWKDLQQDALNSVLEENAYNIEFGSPLHMTPSSLASAPIRRSNIRF